MAIEAKYRKITKHKLRQLWLSCLYADIGWFWNWHMIPVWIWDELFSFDAYTYYKDLQNNGK